MKRGWPAALLCLAMWGCAIGILRMAPSVRHPAYDMQMDAAKRMQSCMEEMAAARAPLDETLDLNRTGLIGVDFSGMTTTLGSLESKRTAATPDAAAMVVRLLDGLKLPQGARVAVNMSGSFPGLNLAVLCALEAMGYEARGIVSLGASTYGANTVKWNALNIHEHLRRRGLLRTRLLAASVGGGRDMGNGMTDENAPAQLKRCIEGRGIPLIEETDYAANVQRRMELMGDVDAYINVGGNWIGGVSGGSKSLPAGIILPGQLELATSDDGLACRYLQKGIPVIHLLNMKALCAMTGLPFDPAPLPEIGASEVYYIAEPSRPLAWLALLVCGGIPGVCLAVDATRRRRKSEQWMT